MSSVDFAAAQRRVAARRQARHAAERARLASQSDSPSTRALARLPSSLASPLARVLNYAQPYINFAHPYVSTIAGREGTNPSFRVGQVDAELLDEELLTLLESQISDATKLFSTTLKDDWAPETALLLRALLFKLTIWDHDASYGASLQNLKYTDARRPGTTRAPPTLLQKSAYGLLSVGGRYAWTKWEEYLLNNDIDGTYDDPSPSPSSSISSLLSLRHLSRLTSLASTTYSLAAFVSFLTFLVNGRYRTLLDRLLRLRLTSTTAHVTKEVSFEYLNRQLVWHAFTEFLLFLLPLVGITRWKKWLARAWRRTRLLFKSRQKKSDNAAEDEEEEMRTVGELSFLPERTCAICHQDANPIGSTPGSGEAVLGANAGIAGSAQTDITNPYEALPCGCKYCFVCLAQRIEAEDGEGWTCLRCGEIVRHCKPWNGDVIEEKMRRGSGKRVSFVVDEEESAPVRHFEDVEPIPIEDEKTLEGEGDAMSSPARALNESTQWAHVNGEASDSSTASLEEEDEEDALEEEEEGYSDEDTTAYSNGK